MPTNKIQVTPSEMPKILHFPRILPSAITVLSIIIDNAIIDDTIDILKRLGLLDYKLKVLEDNKTCLEFLWVKNELPK